MGTAPSSHQPEEGSDKQQGDFGFRRIGLDRAEVWVEYELSLIFGRLGQAVIEPNQARVKRPDNYVGNSSR